MSNVWEFDMYAGECPVKIYKLTEFSQVNKHLTDILEAPNGIPLLLSEQVLKKWRDWSHIWFWNWEVISRHYELGISKDVLACSSITRRPLCVAPKFLKAAKFKTTLLRSAEEALSKRSFFCKSWIMKGEIWSAELQVLKSESWNIPSHCTGWLEGIQRIG